MQAAGRVTKKSILHNKSILVVDDDASLLRALEKVFRSEGAAVTCIATGDEAIEFLIRREKQVDLVITDLRLPSVTGATVVYAVHQIFPALPVIVLTAFASSDVKAACIEQGAVAFLEKPLETAHLLAAIARAFAPSKPGPGKKAAGRG